MHIFFPNYEHHRHRATHSVEEAAAQHGRGGDPVGGVFRRVERVRDGTRWSA